MQSPPSSNPGDDMMDERELRYSEEFTNALMKAALEAPASKGTIVLEKGSNAAPSGDAVRLEEATLPLVNAEELPLSFDDPRRTYRSSVSGIRLTHPGGAVEGGSPSQAPSGATDSSGQVPFEVRQYAQRLIRNNLVKTPAALKRLINTETQKHLEELRGQMQERSEAINTNERIAKEIMQKEAERATERKIEEKMRQKAKTRQEAV
ncbi:MAG: hypothetical protein Q9159_003584 [Coniocarpon cinnabarinum]